MESIQAVEPTGSVLEGLFFKRVVEFVNFFQLLVGNVGVNLEGSPLKVEFVCYNLVVMAKTKPVTMEKVMNDPAYRGYHVIVVAGKVFKARTGERAGELLKEAQEKYPKNIPSITYIPDADSLILWL